MHLRRLFACLCAVSLPLAASAVPMTYQFSGVVSIATATTPPDGSLPVPIIPFGTEFTGFFTYESETPVANQAPGILQYLGAMTDAAISFGSAGEFGVYHFEQKPFGAYTSQSSAISIINDLEFNGNPPYDQFSFTAAMGAAPGDPALMYRYLGFSTGDYTGQQIPPGQTLLDPLPVEAFLSGFHQLSFGYSLFNDAGEEIDSAAVGSQEITLTLTPTPVPAPGTLSLFGAGIVGLWMATRRRRGGGRISYALALGRPNSV